MKTAIIIFCNQLLGNPGRTPTNYTFQFDCDQTQSFNCSATPEVTSTYLTVACGIKRHLICTVTLFAENSAGSTKYNFNLEISKKVTSLSCYAFVLLVIHL